MRSYFLPTWTAAVVGRLAVTATLPERRRPVVKLSKQGESLKMLKSLQAECASDPDAQQALRLAEMWVQKQQAVPSALAQTFTRAHDHLAGFLLAVGWQT